MAYTWFNRFVAIRFMELHGYLDHGLRVLSHPDGKATPEILEKARSRHFTWPRAASTILDLKLDGSQGQRTLSEVGHRPMQRLEQCDAVPVRADRRRDRAAAAGQSAATDSIIRNLVAKIDEDGLGRDRDHRLALPVLHLREERGGFRRAEEEPEDHGRKHPGGDPAFHAALDCSLPR